MKCVNKRSLFAVSVLFAGLLLTGCGGGESSDSAATAQNQGDAAVANKAVLSWEAPATRVNGDGIAMGELDSYIIRYGRSEDDLSNEIVVGDDVAKTDANPEYVIDNLDDGQWYFTIQVRDSQGLLSEPSNVVSKII